MHDKVSRKLFEIKAIYNDEMLLKKNVKNLKCQSRRDSN